MLTVWVCMDPPKKWQNNITRYSMTEEKLIGETKEARENYDLMTAVMVCLGDEKLTEQIESDYKPLLKMLEVLFSQNRPALEKKQIMENDFGIEFNERIEKEAETLCNLSEGVYEKGFTAGALQGMQQGMQQGRTETFYNLVRLGYLSIPQALEQLNISEEEFLRKMKEYQ